MKYILIPLLLFLATSVHARTKAGGACSYDEFGGTCTVTAIDPDGTVRFTYDGSIDGDVVSLRENTATSGGEVGSTSDCTLQFITAGTCTPCLVSIGSCGQEAWAAFTAWAATDALDNGGCSLTAH